MKPLFLEGPSGKLFVSIYLPENGASSASWVLHIPPFAEEMNKCRSMVSRQAYDFSKQGVNVLVPDLFGTGDSEGEFADADWQVWKADLQFLLQWILLQGGEAVTLWGVRIGCLMAVDILDSCVDIPSEKIPQLIFWQPVTSGERFLTQFLRLKVAAAMMAGEKETVSDLRSRSSQGEYLEVAGYMLNPNLVSELSQISLKMSPPSNVAIVNWFEVAGTEGRPLSPASRKVCEEWQDKGIAVTSDVVAGDPFWATQEIATAPALISATTAALKTTITHQSVTKDLSLVKGMDSFSEHPAVFNCQGSQLAGVLHSVSGPVKKGVLLVVGGPQYRVGSHRQFVLLARHLAEQGIPVFRFDYRGMGDSTGEPVDFEGISEDISSAIDYFQNQVEGLQKVVIWGLCDAATAAVFYAPADPRVGGLVLLNPWAYSEQSEARAFLRHYYLQRVLSGAFWQKVFRGEVKIWRSFLALFSKVKGASKSNSEVAEIEPNQSSPLTVSLGERIYRGLNAFNGRVLLVLSGNDLTASEFKDVVNASKRFKRLLKHNRFTIVDIAESDHTFSNKERRQQVASSTSEWIKSW